MSLVKKAPVFYFSNFLTNEEADQLYDEFEKIDVSRHTHLGRKLARNTAVFGDDTSKIPPKIWGDDVPILEWTPIMKKVLEKVKKELKEEFNVCLVNIYDSGKDFIGWHSDNEEKGSIYCIASISIGVSRTFSFLYKSKELESEEEKVNVVLEHGSLLVMNHPCQDLYLHSLPPMKKIKEKRINLTFRKFHYDE